MERTPKRSPSPLDNVKAVHLSDDDKYVFDDDLLSRKSPIQRVQSPNSRLKVIYIPSDIDKDPLVISESS